MTSALWRFSVTSGIYDLFKALRAFRPAVNEIGDLFIDMRFSASVFQCFKVSVFLCFSVYVSVSLWQCSFCV